MTSHRVIGVDLGGTKLLTGVVDARGTVLRQSVEATDTASEDGLLRQLEAAIEAQLDDHVEAIGLGVPAAIDDRPGAAISAANLPLAHVDVVGRIAGRFGLPVAIENDANCAALAEHWIGAARGARHAIVLTLGTGIGGALILDGRLYRGAVGAAGEIGHVVIDLDGPPCLGSCPGRGHLEAMASGTAADALAQAVAAERPDGDLGRAAAAGRTVDARLAAELAGVGPGDARGVIETIADRLGRGVASLVNVFNPELVVIGGGFARVGDLLLEPVRRAVASEPLPPASEVARVVPAALGIEAGLIGAGLVAFERLGLDPR